MFIVVTFLPFRYIMVIYILYRFRKGKKFHERRIQHNAHVCHLELDRFFFSTGMSLDKPWPKQKNLENRLITHFQTHLKIYLPTQIT